MSFHPSRSHPSPYLSNKQTACTHTLVFFWSMKMSKSHSNRVGRPEGEISGSTTPMSITGRSQLQTPTELSKGNSYHSQASTEEMYIVPPIRNPTPATQPMRNCHHSNFHVSPRDFPSKPPYPRQPPPHPQIPSFFFIKSKFLSSFVGLAYEFCCNLLVWNCSSLLFQNKSDVL